MYILDSDIVRLYARHKDQQPQLVRRILATPHDRLWISIVTVEEGIAGARRWEGSDPVRYSQILASVIRDLVLFQILPYSSDSLAIYTAMPERLKQHNRNNWKIGSVALAYGFTLITRNVRHFSQIQPAVPFQDWTR